MASGVSRTGGPDMEVMCPVPRPVPAWTSSAQSSWTLNAFFYFLWRPGRPSHSYFGAAVRWRTRRLDIGLQLPYNLYEQGAYNQLLGTSKGQMWSTCAGLWRRLNRIWKALYKRDVSLVWTGGRFGTGQVGWPHASLHMCLLPDIEASLDDPQRFGWIYNVTIAAWDARSLPTHRSFPAKASCRTSLPPRPTRSDKFIMSLVYIK